jgi:hypothetical protein
MDSLTSYPNNTPPKATNIPTTMAGHDRPGTLSGFLSARPIFALYPHGMKAENEREVGEKKKKRRPESPKV